jgi:outer membrane protein OmpU
MNNLKKIGVSALAGSLVAFAANAGELSVSGGANLTYTNEDLGPNASQSNSTGNPWGHASDVSFNGSGDMNGYTVSFFAALDAGGAGYASNSISMDMGDLGVIKFDQGVGGNGVAAIDDKTPTAWEESWDGLAAGTGLKTTGSQNVFKYSNTVSGFGINVAYDTEIDDSRTTDGATGAAGTSIDGSNYSFAITNNTLMDGLDVGVGYGETDVKNGTTTSTDIEVVVGYANYTMGPVTVGYTMGEQSGGAAGHDMHAVEAYGIAFNVNDNLSISYNNHETKYKKTSGTGTTANADMSSDKDGIAIAYSMGGASVKIQQNESDGSSTSSTYTEDRTYRLEVVIKNRPALHGGQEMLDLLTCLESSWEHMSLMLV